MARADRDAPDGCLGDQSPQSKLAEARQLDEELLAKGVAAEAGLEIGPIGGTQPFVRGTQPVTRRHRVTLGRCQALARRGVRQP